MNPVEVDDLDVLARSEELERELEDEPNYSSS